MMREPPSATRRVSEASALALRQFSAVDWIMLDISSSEALVSSTEAASSLAPEESVWFDSAICADAASSWRLVFSNSPMTCRIGRMTVAKMETQRATRVSTARVMRASSV